MVHARRPQALVVFFIKNVRRFQRQIEIRIDLVIHRRIHRHIARRLECVVIIEETAHRRHPCAQLKTLERILLELVTDPKVELVPRRIARHLSQAIGVL